MEIIDSNFQWGENSNPGSRPNVHLVEFDSDDAIGLFHDHDDRTACGHWLTCESSDEPDASTICVNCLRSGLSRGLLEPVAAQELLDTATDTTKRGVEASPP